MFRASLLFILLFICGCDNMAHQSRLDTYEKSEFFPNKTSLQAPVEGTVEYGQTQAAKPQAWTNAQMQKGQELFRIYCTPCHGVLGAGEGPVVQRGFPAPPTLHSERLREATDSHFYSVITHGAGRMGSYADRLTPQERWAVVAHVRALQLSQNVSFDSLTESEREGLEG